MLKKEWSEIDLVNKWKRKLSDSVSHGLPWKILETLLAGLSDDTKLPRERLAVIIHSRDVSGLFRVAEDLDVTEYSSADLLLQDRLLVEVFSKFDFPESPFDKREKAKLRFSEAEVMCREANDRISRSYGMSTDVNRVIHTAIRYIEETLGRFNVDEMLEFSRFGPGSTLCVKGARSTEYFKLCEKSPTVSAYAVPYARALLSYDHRWGAYLLGIHPFDVAGPFSPLGEAKLTITDHNKVVFVPKNAKTERSIAIEPYFNIFFQLGVGGMLRKRLFRNCGVNLDSQERNQEMARKGSMDGSLATIDFSMASDTLSRELVRLLLPPTWFEHLDRLRSLRYSMEGKPPIAYHKFSSMGCGYTFELESLIFYSIARACAVELGLETGDITVFGDDVILPTAACELFYRVSSYLGFKVNDEKSFRHGFFRESCGEDFLKGFRVRPVFCKELGTVQQVASLANRLLALNRAVGLGSRLNDPLGRTIDLLHQCIPRDVRRLVIGPPSEDVDGYIHREADALARCPLVRWNRRLYCWEHPIIRFKPRSFSRRNDAVALWLCWGLSVKTNPIPKKEEHGVLLNIPHFYFQRQLRDFISESVPREITARKCGDLIFGRRLVWSLGE